VPGDELLLVSWRTLSPSSLRTLNLDLYQLENGVSQRVASTMVGNTVEPNSYTIPVPPGTWDVRATPENAAGFGPESDAPAVTVGNPCSAAELCAHVSSAPSSTNVRLAGQGFLDGVDSASQARALDPRQWRLAGQDAAARSIGVQRTQVLSDLWNNATAPSNGGFARTPWSDWGAWTAFVQATVRASERQGWAPDYWDVWNEPNGTCCPRFSPVDQTTVTVQRWLQTYVLAWQAIKAVDPSAKAIGPSLSALQWAPGDPEEFDLDTFLAYSAAQGVKWDAVSWHENTTAPSPGDIAPSITNVDRHVAMAKAVMARHPGTVVGDQIFVNEYGPKSTHTLAGWTVGYLRAFEDDDIRQANRACWTDAECNQQLDGLLTPTGETTAVWWAHKLYADLTAGTRMRVASSSSWQLDGLAVQDDAARSVRVLLGRHWSCNKAVNTWCQGDATTLPASLAVTVDWPFGTAPVNLMITRLPAGTGAVPEPEAVGSTVAQPTAGTLTVAVPFVADGDAISVIAHPA
jgi:hypothetical protein